MKKILITFIFVLLLVATNEAQKRKKNKKPHAGATGGTIRCWTGTVTSGFAGLPASSLVLTTCPPENSCSTITAAMSGDVAGQAISVTTKVGQCVPTMACRLMTCDQMRSILSSAMPLNLGDCNAECCSEDSCNGEGGETATAASTTTTELAPVGGGPGAAVCQPPFWHNSVGDNWPLAGATGRLARKSKPKFELIVKGLDGQGRYRPGKKYKVILRVQRKKRSSIQMTGFVLSVHPDGDLQANCDVGRFAGPLVQTGCNELISAEFSNAKTKVKGKWIAPRCGTVIMRAMIRDSGDQLYYDTNEDPQYQALTVRLEPASA